MGVILCSGDCQAWEDTNFGVGALTNLLLLLGAGVCLCLPLLCGCRHRREAVCSREQVCSNLTICINECRTLAMKGYSKASGSYLHRSGHTTTIIEVVFCSFTHLRRPRFPQQFNQFFILPPGPLHNITSQPIHKF